MDSENSVNSTYTPTPADFTLGDAIIQDSEAPAWNSSSPSSLLDTVFYSAYSAALTVNSVVCAPVTVLV